MRAATIGVIIFVLAYGITLGFLYYNMHPHPAQLMPRPDTGNHGQGNSFDEHHCPEGTRPYYVQADGGWFFLECMR